jgi:hypothetical protein
MDATDCGSLDVTPRSRLTLNRHVQTARPVADESSVHATRRKPVLAHGLDFMLTNQRRGREWNTVGRCMKFRSGEEVRGLRAW